MVTMFALPRARLRRSSPHRLDGRFRIIDIHASTITRVTARLAQRLRDETRALHVDAERSPFMSVLLRGRMDRVAYAALLRNLLAIYEVLEPALARHAAHPALAPLNLPALARLPSLRDDLARVADPSDATCDLRSAVVRYVARLRELDAANPELLLAHAYVRYLGDLSGGQLLHDIVARSPGLGPRVGTAFYEFGDPAVASTLAVGFRSSLDRAVVDDPDAVVAEARLAFTWHRELFDELARGFGLSA
jgi:heme oxygenase